MTSLASLSLSPHLLPLSSPSDPLPLLPPSASPVVTMLMAKLLLLRVWHKLGLLLGGPFFVPKKNKLPRSRGSFASLRERQFARARERERGGGWQKVATENSEEDGGWGGREGERERVCVCVYTEQYRYFHD